MFKYSTIALIDELMIWNPRNGGGHSRSAMLRIRHVKSTKTVQFSFHDIGFLRVSDVGGCVRIYRSWLEYSWLALHVGNVMFPNC